MNIELTINEIKSLKNNQLSTNRNILEQHSRGEDYFIPKLPDAVFYPKSNQDIIDVVKICNKNKTPIIPFGSGTSLEGHVLPINGGITIDLRKMNNLIKINSQDLDCRVEAGITRKELENELKSLGLFFPIDPGASEATIGGMVATNASGTTSVKYGNMKNNVLSLSFINHEGVLINTGTRAKKSSAGYDLTRLMIGSEGTLGIITEIQLRIYGIPEYITSAICQYKNLSEAVKSAIEIIQSGIPIARIELLDDVQMHASIKYSKLKNLKPMTTLFFEFHGTKNSNEEQAIRVKDISNENNGENFNWANKMEDRNLLWKARHDAYYAALSIKPNMYSMTTDVCVPISNLTKCIIETKKEIKEKNIIAPLVGHVGDGNFHLLILCNRNDKEHFKKVQEFNENLINRALKYEGTCTGEHGVGIGKKNYLMKEHGESLSMMKIIKKNFDPKNIFNPGKILNLNY